MCWVTFGPPTGPRHYRAGEEELLLPSRYVDVPIGVDIDHDSEKYVSNYSMHGSHDHQHLDIEPIYRIAVPEHSSAHLYGTYKDRRVRGRYTEEILRGHGRSRVTNSPVPVMRRRRTGKPKKVRFVDEKEKKDHAAPGAIVDDPNAEFRIQGGGRVQGGAGRSGGVVEIGSDIIYDTRKPTRPGRMRRVPGRENLSAGVGFGWDSVPARRRFGTGYPPFAPLSEW